MNAFGRRSTGSPGGSSSRVKGRRLAGSSVRRSGKSSSASAIGSSLMRLSLTSRGAVSSWDNPTHTFGAMQAGNQGVGLEPACVVMPLQSRCPVQLAGRFLCESLLAFAAVVVASPLMSAHLRLVPAHAVIAVDPGPPVMALQSDAAKKTGALCALALQFGSPFTAVGIHVVAVVARPL
jgi:hypothetical protein